MANQDSLADPAGAEAVGEEEEEEDKSNCCVSCCTACCQSIVETCHDIGNWWYDFGVFLHNCFIAPWMTDYRPTPSAPMVFWLVIQRALRQSYRNYSAMILENVLHAVLGFFLATLTSSGATLTGPLPEGTISLCPYDLGGLCTNPIEDDYIGVVQFLCWCIGFAGIAVGAGTFGNEKPQFWREQSAGMNFVVYFYGKLVADIPRIAVAALCFTAALLTGFATNSTFGKVYGVVVLLYYAGFSLGYVVSAFVSVEMAALLGVAISMLFALALSGATNPTLHDVKDSNGFVQFIFFLSYARWGSEAFYVNEVMQFDYMPIQSYVAARGFVLTNESYNICLRNIFLQALCWQLVALVFLKMNNRQAQK